MLQTNVMPWSNSSKSYGLLIPTLKSRQHCHGDPAEDINSTSTLQ